MPDENRLGRADLIEEVLQGVGKRCNADGCERRRATIARHVPGYRAIAVAERRDLAAPSPRRATDAVKENKQALAGIARGFIAEAAVLGFHGGRGSQAVSPVFEPANANRLARDGKR